MNSCISKRTFQHLRLIDRFSFQVVAIGQIEQLIDQLHIFGSEFRFQLLFRGVKNFVQLRHIGNQLRNTIGIS